MSGPIDPIDFEIGHHNGAVMRPRTLWRRLIGFGFRLLYNELAFSYDSVSSLVSLGQWRDWQRAALPFVKGPLVLEIAPGPGHMLLALDEDGHRVYGLDLSPYMVQIASERMSRNHSNALVVQGQAEQLPFAINTFNTVLTTFPSEFIFNPKTLTGIRRSLVNGGSLVVVLSAQLGGKGLASRLIKELYEITGQEIAPDDADLKSYIRRQFDGLIVGLGFENHVKQIEVRGSLVTLMILEKRKIDKD